MHLKSVRWSLIVDEGDVTYSPHIFAYSVVPYAERCEALGKGGNTRE